MVFFCGCMAIANYIIMTLEVSSIDILLQKVHIDVRNGTIVFDERVTRSFGFRLLQQLYESPTIAVHRVRLLGFLLGKFLTIKLCWHLQDVPAKIGRSRSPCHLRFGLICETFMV